MLPSAWMTACVASRFLVSRVTASSMEATVDPLKSVSSAVRFNLPLESTAAFVKVTSPLAVISRVSVDWMVALLALRVLVWMLMPSPLTVPSSPVSVSRFRASAPALCMALSALSSTAVVIVVSPPLCIADSPL